MPRHVKRGDQVMVIAGADKGKTGRVLRVIPDKNRVVIEGINRVWKHVRPSQRYPQGGRIQKDAPIHLSNVLPLDPASGKGTRVRFKTDSNVKRRIAVRGGTDLGIVKAGAMPSLIPAAPLVPASGA
ncbi:MAG: 50S ribosomal protein L24 [Tepidisphaeraceae bacterium]